MAVKAALIAALPHVREMVNVTRGKVTLFEKDLSEVHSSTMRFVWAFVLTCNLQTFAFLMDQGTQPDARKLAQWLGNVDHYDAQIASVPQNADVGGSAAAVEKEIVVDVVQEPEAVEKEIVVDVVQEPAAVEKEAVVDVVQEPAAVEKVVLAVEGPTAVKEQLNSHVTGRIWELGAAVASVAVTAGRAGGAAVASVAVTAGRAVADKFKSEREVCSQLKRIGRTAE